jgi:hypothetical protein
VDLLFFRPAGNPMNYLIIKILYFIFLLFSWKFIIGAFKRIRAKDEFYCRGFFVFSVYLSLMMLLLVIFWPGTWAWDDLIVLSHIRTYGTFYPWQHVITGIYQDVLLQILPFPGGIVLLQNIIISICVAFCVTKLEKSFGIGQFKHRIIDIFIKILPFLLPPVLMYQFSGYRMGLYVYLELTMLVMIICAIKDKKEWNMEYLVLFGFLCVVTAAWRTESFIYIPILSFVVLMVNKNVIPLKKKILCILILNVGFVGVYAFQSSELGTSNYEVISVLRPAAELVRIADPIEDAESLRAIDEVARLDIIYQFPELNGELLYHYVGAVRSDYTKEDYSSFLKAVVKLTLKYPDVVVAERWNLFIKGSGITGESETNVAHAAEVFDEGNGNAFAAEAFSFGWVANTPLSVNLRKGLINLLGQRNSDGTYFGVVQRVIWNSIIPMLLLTYAWIKMLAQKKWYWLLIFTAVLIRVPVVVLTQPSGWLMYELSFYFLGYVFLLYGLLIWRGHRKQKEKEENA